MVKGTVTTKGCGEPEKKDVSVTVSPQTELLIESTAKTLGVKRTDVIITAFRKGRKAFEKKFSDGLDRFFAIKKIVTVSGKFAGQPIERDEFRGGQQIPSGTVLVSNELMAQKRKEWSERIQEGLTFDELFGGRRKRGRPVATLNDDGKWIEGDGVEESDVYMQYSDENGWEYKRGG